MPEIAIFPLEHYESSFPTVQFFKYAHLPEDKQVVSRPFGELAQHLCNTLPPNSQLSMALDLLLLSKDAAVRSSFQK